MLGDDVKGLFSRLLGRTEGQGAIKLNCGALRFRFLTSISSPHIMWCRKAPLPL